MIEHTSISKMHTHKYDNKGDRQNSQSRNSSSNKFLKRKQDRNKVMCSSKKKRESAVSQYFLMCVQPQQAKSVSDHYIQARFITDNKQNKIEQKNKGQQILMLETARSEDNLFVKKQLRAYKSNVYQDRVSRQSQFSTHSEVQFTHLQSNQLLASPQPRKQSRNNPKKSMTEFFTHDQLAQLQSDISNNEEGSPKQEDGPSKLYFELKKDYQCLNKRNKQLQEQLDLYAQKQYLLQTQQKQLYQIIKEKDALIKKLQIQRQSFLLKTECNQTKKYQYEINVLKHLLSKQEQRNINMKEQSDYIQNELILKNEELIVVYNQYADLQSRCRKQQQRLRSQLESMKVELQKFRKQSKESLLDYGHLNQSEKWRQQIFKQQEEIKYLKIQNQCLLISKDQLNKSENQIRKLRDERDYFKMKVMQSIKRNKSKILDHSQNSSIMFQLSDISIEGR